MRFGVAQGTYKPDQGARITHGDRRATFRLKNEVAIKGGYAGAGTPDPNARDIQLYETILSGDLDSNDVDTNEPADLLDDPNRSENSYHVVTGSGTDATAVLDGFTITAGNASGSDGGGMYNYAGSPTLINCTFSENSAEVGGGMCNLFYSSPMLTNCTFRDNSASDHGGGIWNWRGSNPMLASCLFSSNSASSGGGMSNYDNTGATLTNCTFAANSAIHGNALACDSDEQDYPSSVHITNCIFWDGGDEIWNNDNSVITITYSDVQEDWLGEGNIDAEPCFVEPGYWDANGVWIEGDYHLLQGSPCIDAGDPDYVAEPNETDLDGRPRVIGGRIDMGAYESPIPAEVRIVPRTINLTSRGKWITCYISLPEDYNVADIIPHSVVLEAEIEPESFRVDEQQQVAVAKFSRSNVQEILNVGEVKLTITGQLSDGTIFEGTDTIKVIDKAGKN